MNKPLILRPTYFDEPVPLWPSKSLEGKLPITHLNAYDSLNNTITEIMDKYYSGKVLDDVIVNISCDGHEETIFCALAGDLVSYWETAPWDWYEGEKEVYINWICPFTALDGVMEVYKMFKEEATK